jgi:hypothetical protein
MFPDPDPDAEVVSPPSPLPSEPGSEKPLPRSHRVHGLTLRQNAFCEFFVALGNAADAARQAGYCERAARNQGYRLLKDARVRARIRALQTAIVDKIDPALILGRLENLYCLAERDGGYRAAARILVLMGRLVGFDYGGMAAYLRTPRATDEASTANGQTRK